MERNKVPTSVPGLMAVDVLARNRELRALAKFCIGTGIVSGAIANRLEKHFPDVEKYEPEIETYINDVVRGVKSASWNTQWNVQRRIYDDLSKSDFPAPERALEGLRELVAIAQEED